MRPDIGFERRHVEIANQQGMAIAVAGPPSCESLEVSQFLLELGIERGVRNIAARRHIDIVKRQRLSARKLHGAAQMPGLGGAAEALPGQGAKRQFRNRGDAMIAGLARDLDVRIAKFQEDLARKQLLHAFDFLKAEDVRPRLRQKAGYQSGTEPDAIDIPGGDFQHLRKKKRPTPAKVGRFCVFTLHREGIRR